MKTATKPSTDPFVKAIVKRVKQHRTPSSKNIFYQELKKTGKPQGGETY